VTSTSAPASGPEPSGRWLALNSMSFASRFDVGLPLVVAM
jgi:hypothetical protein